MTKPDGFDERLAHSLDLVRKSERTALIYDNADGFYLAFSGGNMKSGKLVKVHQNVLMFKKA